MLRCHERPQMSAVTVKMWRVLPGRTHVLPKAHGAFEKSTIRLWALVLEPKLIPSVTVESVN